MSNGMNHGMHSHRNHTEPDFHDDMHAFLIPIKPGDPGPDKLKKIHKPHFAIIVHKHGPIVQLKRTNNPNPNGSLGYIDRFVKVPESGVFHPGTLVISFPPNRLGSVAMETLRVFLWKEQEKSYRLIHRSGVGQSRDYVWALIEEPGIYAVIGVNADPLVARTLGMLHYLHGWLHVAGQPAQNRLHRRLCQLVLSNSEMRYLANNKNTARLLVEENLRHGLPGKWPGGIPPRKTQQAWRKIENICNSPDFPHEPPEAQLISLDVSIPAEGGQWEVLEHHSEIIAIHAALLRTGQVLYFSGSAAR